MQVTVNPAQGTVVIDGLALKCIFAVPDGVQSIHWAGKFGTGQQSGGTGHGVFYDPAVIAPYVAAWRTEMQARIAATEAAEAVETAAYQARVAQQEQIAQEQQAAAQADADAAAAAAETQAAS